MTIDWADDKWFRLNGNAIGWLFLIRLGFYYKKIIKLKIFKNKLKLVQTSLARFFPVWLSFFRFGLVFPVLARFGLVFFWFDSVFSVWIRFSFLGFKLIKPKSNRTGRFFQNFIRFNRFFSRFSFSFFGYFFSSFLSFSIFLLTPSNERKWSSMLHSFNMIDNLYCILSFHIIIILITIKIIYESHLYK